jgi:hypothetical protein
VPSVLFVSALSGRADLVAQRQLRFQVLNFQFADHGFNGHYSTSLFKSSSANRGTLYSFISCVRW